MSHLLLAFAAAAQLSIASAAQWSPATNVHPQTGFSDGYPEIVTTLDGTTWITWMGIDPISGDEEAYFSRWNGSAWEAAGTINPPNQSDDRFPRLSCAPQGALWATWTSPEANGTTYCGLTSRWMGAAWTQPDTVWTGGGRYDYVETQAVSASEAWLVRDGTGSGGGRDVFVYHLVAGSLDPVQQFVQPDTDENLPSIAVGTDGVPWVAWYQVPGPPPDPSNSRLQVSRLEPEGWTAPETIPSPTAINRHRIIAGPDLRRWIVCAAPDPSVGPFSSAIWSLESQGSAWGAPERISDLIAAPDSSQYQLSGGQSCGGFPRAVWLVRDIDVYTRADILTSAFTGTLWGPVERVGMISDSAYASWPALAYANGRTWVAYMRDVPPTFVSNVFTTYSDDPSTAVTSVVEVSAAARDGGVQVLWTVPTTARGALAHIWRASGSWNQARPAIEFGAERLRTVTQDDGAVFDGVVAPGAVYTYWVEIEERNGALWGGPASISLPPATPGPRSVTVSPNPSRGKVAFRCAGGVARSARLEIFDLGGRLIRRLPSEREPQAGAAIFEWDGRGMDADPAPSGVYFARLLMGGPRPSVERVRFVLIR